MHDTDNARMVVNYPSSPSSRPPAYMLYHISLHHTHFSKDMSLDTIHINCINDLTRKIICISSPSEQFTIILRDLKHPTPCTFESHAPYIYIIRHTADYSNTSHYTTVRNTNSSKGTVARITNNIDTFDNVITTKQIQFNINVTSLYDVKLRDDCRNEEHRTNQSTTKRSDILATLLRI